MPSWVAALLVAGLAIGAYATSLDGAWQYDDLPTVRDNPGIRGLGAFLRAFEHFQHRPLLFLSFALNFELGGIDPFGYHLVNVLLHAANAVLVGALARRLALAAGGSARGRDALMLLAGALFAVHPITTEAVSYVSSRSSVLATTFYLLAVHGYLAARERQGRAALVAWGGVFLAFGLSMTTKEIAMSLPLVLVAMEHGLPWRGGRPASWKRTLAWAGPMLGLLATAVLVRLIALGFRHPSGVPWDYPTHLATQCRAALLYLRLLVLPVNQTVDHDLPLSTGFGTGEAAGLAVLVAVIASALVARRRAPVYTVTVAWALICLAPTSLIPLLDPIAERRLYLPLAGVAPGAAIGLVALARGGGEGRRRTVAAMSLAIVVLFALGTQARNRVWATPLALWRDAVRKAPFKARPHGSFGTALAQSGQIAPALEEYDIAIELDPRFWDYRVARAVLKRLVGRYEETLAELEELLADPQAARVHVEAAHELAETYRLRGEITGSTADLEEALRLHRASLDAGRPHRETLLRIGRILFLLGRDAEARDAFERHVRERPDDPKGYRTLAMLELRAGDRAAAEGWLERALEVDPSDARTRSWIDDLRAGRPIRVE